MAWVLSQVTTGNGIIPGNWNFEFSWHKTEIVGLGTLGINFLEYHVFRSYIDKISGGMKREFLYTIMQKHCIIRRQSEGLYTSVQIIYAVWHCTLYCFFCVPCYFL